MTFEVYTRLGEAGTGRRPLPGLTVSLNRQGTVALSAGAYAVLGRPAHVRVLVDVDRHALRLERADDVDGYVVGDASPRYLLRIRRALMHAGWTPGLQATHVVASVVAGGLEFTVSGA